MDAVQALADLTEISSQIVEVAILDRDGSLLASTAPDPGRAERFVDRVKGLLEEADRIAAARGVAELAQVEVSTHAGSVFAVRREGRLIVAATRPDPTVGLVLYDLKHCIASLEGPPARRNGRRSAAATGTRRRPRTRKADTSA